MVVPTHFELESLKDQLSLIGAFISHINWEEFAQKKEEAPESLDIDYVVLLEKMEKTTVNLKQKYTNLKTILNN